MRSHSDGHPWREPWSASAAAAGPRPSTTALEGAIARMYAAGNSVATIAAATRLREDRIQEILRAYLKGAP